MRKKEVVESIDSASCRELPDWNATSPPRQVDEDENLASTACNEQRSLWRAISPDSSENCTPVKTEVNIMVITHDERSPSNVSSPHDEGEDVDWASE